MRDRTAEGLGIKLGYGWVTWGFGLRVGDGDQWEGMGDSGVGVDLSYLKILRSDASPDDTATLTGSELVQSHLVNLALQYILEGA